MSALQAYPKAIDGDPHLYVHACRPHIPTDMRCRAATCERGVASMLHLREDAAGGEARVGHRLVAHGPELVRVMVQELQAFALQPALHLRPQPDACLMLAKPRLRASLS